MSSPIPSCPSQSEMGGIETVCMSCCLLEQPACRVTSSRSQFLTSDDISCIALCEGNVLSRRVSVCRRIVLMMLS